MQGNNILLIVALIHSTYTVIPMEKILSVRDEVDMSFIYEHKRCSSTATINYWRDNVTAFNRPMLSINLSGVFSLQLHSMVRKLINMLRLTT